MHRENLEPVALNNQLSTTCRAVARRRRINLFPVVLPISDYEKLLEDSDDLAVVAERPDEPIIRTNNSFPSSSAMASFDQRRVGSITLNARSIRLTARTAFFLVS